MAQIQGLALLMRDEHALPLTREGEDPVDSVDFTNLSDYDLSPRTSGSYFLGSKADSGHAPKKRYQECHRSIDDIFGKIVTNLVNISQH